MRVLALLPFLAAAKDRPVTRVIKLLREMQTQLETEKDTDAATYKKFQCWCKNTIPETEGSIKANTECIESQTGAIEESTGAISKTETQIANLGKEIEEETAELKAAQAQREKEEDEFNATEKELTKAIGGLKAAVTVLKKHQGNFMQTSAKALMPEVTSSLQSALTMSALSKHVNSAITPTQRETLTKFLQQPTFAAYGSQSGQIFGILSSMLEEFENDLASETEENGQSAAAFAETKKMKNQLIAQKNAQLKEKEEFLAKKQADFAEAQEQKAACEESLAADQKKLADAQKSCQENEQEYTDRSAARDEELEAVAKAIEFLDSDEAHDMFSSTFGFMQVKAQNKSKRTMIANKLRAVASVHKGEILALAQKIPAGAFTKIIETIDKLVKDIENDMANDVAKKDECNAGIHKLTSEKKELENNKATKEAELKQAEEKIEQLKADMEEYQAAIDASRKEMAEASQVRQAQNTEFQQTVHEQTASIKILNKALAVLASVYEKNSFAQQPASFKKYEQSSGGNKVLTMIRTIISDAEKDKALTIAAENDSQAAYEEMVKATNESIASSTTKFNDAKAAKADTEELAANLTDDIANLTDQLTSKTTALENMQQECNFILKNFSARQEHMAAEKKALNEAKAFLQGMQ